MIRFILNHLDNKKARHPVGLFRIGSLGMTPVVPPILVRLFIFILRNVLFSYDFMILNTRDCEYPQNP